VIGWSVSRGISLSANVLKLSRRSSNCHVLVTGSPQSSCRWRLRLLPSCFFRDLERRLTQSVQARLHPRQWHDFGDRERSFLFRAKTKLGARWCRWQGAMHRRELFFNLTTGIEPARFWCGDPYIGNIVFIAGHLNQWVKNLYSKTIWW